MGIKRQRGRLYVALSLLTSFPFPMSTRSISALQGYGGNFSFNSRDKGK